LEYSHKKSLGQHFLNDEEICKKIVSFADTNQENWLEVGPGAGAITKYLLKQNFKNFKAIEIDQEKFIYLQKTFPALQGKIILQDILKADIPYDNRFSVIGNFPYNISTQIVFKLLDWRNQIEMIVGMFQKEVALRYASKHGSKDYGITSVITQCYFDIEYALDIPPSAFTPPPKVDSAVIILRNNNNPYNIADYNHFKSFIKAAFSQRRKTLRNALKSILPAEKLQDELFGKRAEQISVEGFVLMYKQLYGME
jgi:16S rRNA (adenine1518-N6/adenine1519-N6)-dimethyltransferase